jgi:hypothetical protein
MQRQSVHQTAMAQRWKDFEASFKQSHIPPTASVKTSQIWAKGKAISVTHRGDP